MSSDLNMCDFALIALFFLSSAVLEAMLAGSKLLLFRGLESGEPYMTSANLSHLWTPPCRCPIHATYQ